MDELNQDQTDEVEVEVVDDMGGVSNVEKDDETIQKRTVFSDEQQDALDGIIEKRLKREKKRHEQQLEEERLKRLELEQQLNPGDENLTVPDMPDPLDPDYEQKIVEREEIKEKKLTAQAKLEAKKELNEDAIRTHNEKALQKRLTNYQKNARNCGISNEKLDEYSGELMNAGVKDLPDVCQFFVHRKKGPLVVKYLSENEDDLDSLLTIGNIADRSEYLLKIESKLKVDKKPPPDEVTGNQSSGASVSGSPDDWKKKVTRGAVFQSS